MLVYLLLLGASYYKDMFRYNFGCRLLISIILIVAALFTYVIIGFGFAMGGGAEWPIPNPLIIQGIPFLVIIGAIAYLFKGRGRDEANSNVNSLDSLDNRERK